MTTKNNNDLTTDLLDEDDQDEQQELAECSTANTKTIPFPFLPLYSQYGFGQRLKNTIPFSKLFFSNNIKPLNYNNNINNKIINKNPEIIHDKDQCMFLLKLDSKGRTAAICYLPTRVKNVIEVYHTEIPPNHRHKGVGDRLVQECLIWAKESGTFVIPTCNFVKRHLEYNGFQKYGPVIVKNEQEAHKNKVNL